MDAGRFLASVQKLNTQFAQFVQGEVESGKSDKLLTKVTLASLHPDVVLCLAIDRGQDQGSMPLRVFPGISRRLS